MMSDKDRATLAKMRRDTEDIIARRRRDDMTRNTKARQKGLEDYSSSDEECRPVSPTSECRQEATP